ncbi:hypothetical protein [Campylobacter avium]|uniref:hypothetical protein n=1 Tax=Campylobacter avium TaxID=522485 RepID=UPI00248ADCC2|nr:hypothetical protein [Campylobacter avium]
MAFSLKKTLLAKRIKKFRNRALENWGRTIKEYDLRIDVNSLYSEANDYGYVMAQRGFLGALVNIITNPVNLLILAVYIVVQFIPGLNVVANSTLPAWFSSLVSAVNITANIASVVSTAYNQQKLLNAEIGAYGEIASSSLNESVQDARRAKAKSETLTNFLIYAPYEILPKGSVYNDKQLGGQNTNFRYSEPYDAMKGINGELKPLDEAEEMSYNRYQKKDAGNINYANETLGGDVPLVKAISTNEYAMLVDEAYKARCIKSTSGFQKMLEQGYGLGVGDANTFQYTWNRIDAATIKPFQSQKCQLDFLEKNKAYQKGLLRDFFTQELYHFKVPEVDIKNQEQSVYETMYKDLKELFATNIPDDEKAMFYVDMLGQVFEAVFLGEEVFSVERIGDMSSVAKYIFYNHKLSPSYNLLTASNYNNYNNTNYKNSFNLFTTYLFSFDNMKENDFKKMFPTYESFLSFAKFCMGEKTIINNFAYVDIGDKYNLWDNKYLIVDNIEVDIFKISTRETTSTSGGNNGGVWTYWQHTIDKSKPAFEHPKLIYLDDKEYLANLEDKTIIKFLKDSLEQGFLEIPVKDETQKQELDKLLQKHFDEYARLLFEEEGV